MAETYGSGSLVGVTVWFATTAMQHGRQGVVVEHDAAARRLVVEDDGSERHSITFDSLLPW
jgi:hypothetical protein